MSYEYIDRSSVTLDEFEDEDLRISMLKRQTGKAIDEATAKLLLTQAKLNNALTKLVPGRRRPVLVPRLPSPGCLLGLPRLLLLSSVSLPSHPLFSLFFSTFKFFFFPFFLFFVLS